VRGSHQLGVRSRLLLAVVVATAIALTVGVTAFNVLLAQRLSASATSLARAQAEAELLALRVVKGRLVPVEGPDEGRLGTPIWVFQGKRTLEAPPIAARISAAAATLAVGPERSLTVDAKVRLYALPITSKGARVGTVVTSVSLDAYQATKRSALTGSLILAALLLVAITLLAWWILGRALRPVSRMTDAAATWSEHDLNKRFHLGEPHDELTRLGATLDTLLSRLAASLRHEQLFAAELSHELRTPLARITTEAELAIKRERTNNEYRAGFQAVLQSSQQMTRTIEALVAAARQETGISRASCDVREAVRTAVEALTPTAAEHGLEIAFDLPSAPVRVAADTELVAQIIRPLLDNAVRYGSHRATVQLHSDGANAIVSVADDGPGVDAAEQEQVFDPGVRGSAAQSAAADGAGLGLALARRLARSAGGEITAEPSTAGGQFTLSLPLA